LSLLTGCDEKSIRTCRVLISFPGNNYGHGFRLPYNTEMGALARILQNTEWILTVGGVHDGKKHNQSSSIIVLSFIGFS
jgi:hypothetical protein